MPTIKTTRQPLCPLRDGEPCMGAMCAWSRHTVNDDGMWLFSCAIAGEGHGVAVIDRRGGERKPDPVERT